MAPRYRNAIGDPSHHMREHAAPELAHNTAPREELVVIYSRGRGAAGSGALSYSAEDEVSGEAWAPVRCGLRRGDAAGGKDSARGARQ